MNILSFGPKVPLARHESTTFSRWAVKPVVRFKRSAGVPLSSYRISKPGRSATDSKRQGGMEMDGISRWLFRTSFLSLSLLLW